MKKNTLLCIAIIIVFSFNIYSQKASLASADKKYDSYAYINAIKTYNMVQSPNELGRNNVQIN